MNAATKQGAGEIAVAEVQDYSAGLLAVIERATRDTSVDIDKMERLMAMYERAQERNAKLAFLDAKLAMKPKLPHIDRRGRIILREKTASGKRDGEIIQDTGFARFEDIHEAVMPILHEHGFDLDYRNGLAPDGKVRVTTILSHVAGHQEETHFDLPHDTSGSKNAVQAIGSSTSYGQRYGTVSILNLRIAGADDDGAKAVPGSISDDQIVTITALMQEVGADKVRFLKYMGVKSVEDIAAERYGDAIAALEAKRAK